MSQVNGVTAVILSFLAFGTFALSGPLAFTGTDPEYAIAVLEVRDGMTVLMSANKEDLDDLGIETCSVVRFLEQVLDRVGERFAETVVDGDSPEKPLFIHDLTKAEIEAAAILISRGVVLHEYPIRSDGTLGRLERKSVVKCDLRPAIAAGHIRLRGRRPGD